MPTMFTEFRFFNRSPRPATATLHSAPQGQPFVQRCRVSAPPDGIENPNADRQQMARVVVATDGMPSRDIGVAAPIGQFLNGVGVTLNPDFTLAIVRTFGI